MTLAMTRALDLHAGLGYTDKPQFPTPEQQAAWNAANLSRASLNDDNWPKKIFALRKLFNLSKFDSPHPGHPISQLREMLHRGLFTEEFAETIWPGEENAERRKALVHEARDSTPEDGTQHFLDINILVETVDGILDTVVVGLGWLCEMGLSPMQINLLMEEIHASNMTKVDDTGAPIFDNNGKFLKGPNYVPADIKGLLERFIAEAKTAGEEPSRG